MNVCHMRGISSLCLHTHAKLMTDTQVHAHTLFAHAVTCGTTHTEFFHMH